MIPDGGRGPAGEGVAEDRGSETLLAFVEDARLRFMGLDARSVVEEVDARLRDVEPALGAALHDGGIDAAYRFVTALAPFWMALGRLADGVAWGERVLARGGGDPGRRGRAATDTGLLAFWTGDDERAGRWHQEALRIGREIGDVTVTALALAGLARIALRSDVTEAERLCREGLALTEGTADRLGRSSALHVLAVARQMSGDLEEAGRLMRERLELGRAMGNVAVVSVESGNLSMVERQLGRLDAAEALARESLEIDVRRGDQWLVPYKLNALAAIAAAGGAFERAATLLGAAEAMVEAQGAEWPPDERQQYDEACRRLEVGAPAGVVVAAKAAGARMSLDDLVAYVAG